MRIILKTLFINVRDIQHGLHGEQVQITKDVRKTVRRYKCSSGLPCVDMSLQTFQIFHLGNLFLVATFC